MTETAIKRIAISEFRSEGYLQELNRRFLHPLGLALEIEFDTDEVGVPIPDSERLGGVWDYREDPEGVYFDQVGLADRASHVDALWEAREPARRAALGYMVQPPDAEAGA